MLLPAQGGQQRPCRPARRAAPWVGELRPSAAGSPMPTWGGPCASVVKHLLSVETSLTYLLFNNSRDWGSQTPETGSGGPEVSGSKGKGWGRELGRVSGQLQGGNVGRGSWPWRAILGAGPPAEMGRCQSCLCSHPGGQARNRACCWQHGSWVPQTWGKAGQLGWSPGPGLWTDPYLCFLICKMGLRLPPGCSQGPARQARTCCTWQNLTDGIFPHV